MMIGDLSDQSLMERTEKLNQLMGTLSEEEKNFLALLEADYSWPDLFTFRFIVKAKYYDQFEKLYEELKKHDLLFYLDQHQVIQSGEKNYQRINFRVLVNVGLEVIFIYRFFKDIPEFIKI